MGKLYSPVTGGWFCPSVLFWWCAAAHCGLSQAARALGVDCLVAPYEADAQLAYLNKAGLVQAVITEDSDLLAFGCKKVLHCSCYTWCAVGEDCGC